MASTIAGCGSESYTRLGQSRAAPKARGESGTKEHVRGQIVVADTSDAAAAAECESRLALLLHDAIKALGRYARHGSRSRNCVRSQARPANFSTFEGVPIRRWPPRSCSLSAPAIVAQCEAARKPLVRVLYWRRSLLRSEREISISFLYLQPKSDQDRSILHCIEGGD
jgi:hypothetical protein